MCLPHFWIFSAAASSMFINYTSKIIFHSKWYCVYICFFKEICQNLGFHPYGKFLSQCVNHYQNINLNVYRMLLQFETMPNIFNTDNIYFFMILLKIMIQLYIGNNVYPSITYYMLYDHYR